MKTLIEIDEISSPKLTVINNSGAKRTIETNMVDILKMFDDSYEMKIEKKKVNLPKTNVIERIVYKEPAVLDFKETPILPKSLVKYACRRRNGAEIDAQQEHILAFSVESFHATFTYHNTKMNNVAFPNLVFVFKIVDNQIISRNVACYKSLNLRDNTELFLFPYAHVSNTNMCYGERGGLTDLVELDTWSYRWASVEMTDHFYHESRNLITASLRELLELFSDDASFDYDILRPLNMTFKEFFSKSVESRDVLAEHLKPDETDKILELIASPSYTKYQKGGQLQTN